MNRPPCRAGAEVDRTRTQPNLDAPRARRAEKCWCWHREYRRELSLTCRSSTRRCWRRPCSWPAWRGIGAATNAAVAVPIVEVEPPECAQCRTRSACNDGSARTLVLRKGSRRAALRDPLARQTDKNRSGTKRPLARAVATGKRPTQWPCWHGERCFLIVLRRRAGSAYASGPDKLRSVVDVLCCCSPLHPAARAV